MKQSAIIIILFFGIVSLASTVPKPAPLRLAVLIAPCYSNGCAILGGQLEFTDLEFNFKNTGTDGYCRWVAIAKPSFKFYGTNFGASVRYTIDSKDCENIDRHYITIDPESDALGADLTPVTASFLATPPKHFNVSTESRRFSLSPNKKQKYWITYYLAEGSE